MKASELFPSKYIRAGDVRAPVRVTIADYRIEEIGQEKDRRAVLYFRNAEKGLVLNKTNTGTLADAFGDEMDDWIGKPIEVYRGEASYQGRVVGAVRVRAIGEGPVERLGSTPPPQPSPHVDEPTDDDIPF